MTRPAGGFVGGGSPRPQKRHAAKNQHECAVKLMIRTFLLITKDTPRRLLIRKL